VDKIEIVRSVINHKARTLTSEWTVEYAELDEVYIPDSVLEEIEQQIIAEIKKAK
jgi:hypothetical protein